jgi:small redox-active disulfide protein 2
MEKEPGGKKVIDGSMKIHIFGSTPPCARCKMTEKLVKRAIEELGYDDIEVVKLDALSEEGERLGIVMTPTTVIEDKIVKMGGVPSKDEVKRAIEKMRKAEK